MQNFDQVEDRTLENNSTFSENEILRDETADHIDENLERENQFLPSHGDLINASFVIGEFYDGGTLFQRTDETDWSLMLSILNNIECERL